MTRPNLLLILLLISVALNGILFGASARDWFGPDEAKASSLRLMLSEEGSPRHAGRLGGPGFDTRGFLMSLPPDQRERARAYMREQRQVLSSLRREAIQARLAATQALSASEFDRALIEARFAQAREARAAVEAHTEGVILALVESMDPEDRETALQAALGPDRFGPPHRRGARPPHGPPPHDHRPPHRSPPDRNGGR